MKTIWVVAAALIDDQNRVLIATRPDGKDMAGMWEFPGGKVAENESPEAALARELEEELKITIAAADLQTVGFSSHAYEKFHVVIMLFLCRKWFGNPYAAEGQKLRWEKIEQLNEREMPAADIPLISSLRKVVC